MVGFSWRFHRQKPHPPPQGDTNRISSNNTNLIPETPTNPTALPISLSASSEPGLQVPDKHPIGLFQLKGENVVLDPLLPRYHVDIIAIHGLNGNAYTTWTSKQNQLWLDKHLPHSLPGARVFTFGYNATIFSYSRADIGDFARKLLTYLNIVRQSEGVLCQLPKYFPYLPTLAQDQKREIIFICHSLGGIVCKKALVLAHESPLYTNILQLTKSIVFFGTPHQGSEQAAFLSILTNIVDKFGSPSLSDRAIGRIRHRLVSTLKPRSKELEALSMSFTQRSKDLDIISFYEENAMPPFKNEIVPRNSARIGVPNEELIPLSSNHTDMCRLESENAFGYEKTVQVCQKYGTQLN